LLNLIAHQEPRPLRAIDKTIPRELETIILKAIAKTPAERYATAEDLAEDLQRFLEDKPVKARRPTALDKAARWSRRHKPLVRSAVALMVLTLVILSFSTVLIAREQAKAEAAFLGERRKAVEALEQRARAEANFQQARRTVDFLVQICEEELPDRPPTQAARKRLLEEALAYYQEFIDQQSNDPSVQAELAASQARVERILSQLPPRDRPGRPRPGGWDGRRPGDWEPRRSGERGPGRPGHK
jgi:hypothetical protein